MSKVKKIPPAPKARLSMGSWVASADNDLIFPVNPIVTNYEPSINGSNEPVPKPSDNPPGKPIIELLPEPIAEPSPIPSPELSVEPTSEPSFEPLPVPLSEPATKPSAKPSFKNVSLDATHKASETRVYSILYRETITKGKSDAWTSVPEICRATGIRSENTVRLALGGLVAKRSIHLIEKRSGPSGGWHVRVYAVKEIFENRKAAGIEIDERTKNIIPSVNGSAIPSPAPSLDRSAGAINDGLKGARIEPSKSEGHDKYNINLPVPPTVVVAPHDDNLAKVRKLFEQLSNGGQWREEHCLPAYEEIRGIEIAHIILGLCYSISKSPEHRMSSLAYAVNSIKKHAEDMDDFSHTDLIEIAYRRKRITLNCIATGKWLIPEWEKEV